MDQQPQTICNFLQRVRVLIRRTNNRKAKIMGHSFAVVSALFAGALVVTNGISAETPTSGSVAGKWEGTFTPTSQLGALRAKVELTRESGRGTVSGTNVTGVWKGALNKIGPSGRVTPAPFLLNLKQEGTRLSGTAGSSEKELVEIVKGTIDGERVLFEAPHHPAGPIIKFDLKLVDGHIRGGAAMEPKEERVPGRGVRATFEQHGDEITGNIRFKEDEPIV